MDKKERFPFEEHGFNELPEGLDPIYEYALNTHPDALMRIIGVGQYYCLANDLKAAQELLDDIEFKISCRYKEGDYKQIQRLAKDAEDIKTQLTGFQEEHDHLSRAIKAHGWILADL